MPGVEDTAVQAGLVERQNILIVDDQEKNLFALETILEDIDAKVIRASSGNEALKATLNHRFALALLDVQMPGMDGYELAEILRQDDEIRQIPVVFMSAIHSDEDHMIRGFEAGAVDFIVKPFNPRYLLAKVRVLLQLDRYRTEQTRNLARFPDEDPNPVLRVLNNGVISYANRGSRALLASLGCTVGDDLPNGLRTAALEALSSGEARQVETRCGAGTLLLFITPVTGAGYVNLYGMDITQRIITEHKLNTTLQELKRSNQELEQFAYVTSHDLQEPLRSVAGFLQILERRHGTKLDADARRLIGKAVDGAGRMQGLINDLLNYSRVGTRGKQLHPVNSREALDQALVGLELAIEKSGAVITCGDLPMINADEIQVKQLLQNLISNAIKFCRDCRPRITVTAGLDSGKWHFTVQDNGIGFNQKYEERIFRIFQRLHGQGTYPGTGIGLAICRRIIDRHGGRIWAESQPGEGTVFHFTLPAAAVEDGGLDDSSAELATAPQLVNERTFQERYSSFDRKVNHG